MKKLLLFLILLANPILGTASHIVGGEFELVHISGFLYKLNMVIYFDEVSGEQGAKDFGGEDVKIFRMFDDAFMMNVHVDFDEEVLVKYTQSACQSDFLKTSKLLYSTEITLPGTVFNHPKGYYIAWERCCRNYGITNIFSQNATTGWAGQTFYLQFPPVMKDGKQFIDSTPRLFPPLSDYACAQRPYYADFRGTDDDGDSLVYSMATPLSTGTNAPVPPITPQPYPDVTWRTPFSITNIMNGAPDLRISRDGLLRVTPTLVGLFVFAVKVEQFRNKIKIGETRRDFQMLVMDCPPFRAGQPLDASAIPPVITGRQKTKTLFQPHTLVADFTGVSDDDRCVEIQVTDDDSNKASLGFQEKIKVKVVPLNFKKDISALFPILEATLTHGSVANFSICFKDCPFIVGNAVIGIIAMDDACSLPLMDTLKVTIIQPPPPNSKPQFSLPTPNPYNATLVDGNEFFAATIHQGDASGNQLITPFSVKDGDPGEVVDVSVVTNGFVLADAGMTVTSSPSANQVDGLLKWEVFCQLYDFTKRKDFRVTVFAEDRDRCLLANPLRAVFNLTFDPPANANPVIMTDLAPSHERSITGIIRHIDEPLTINIKGTDADADYLVTTGAGKDFALSTYKATVSPSPATGNSVTSSTFQWAVSCASIDLKKKDTFDFRFIVVDSLNLCHFRKTDTVDVQVKVIPPINHPPLLTITNQNSPATVYYNNGIDMTLGPAIKLLLTGTDSDILPTQDNLKIDIASATGNVKPVGYTFTPVTGKSPIQASLVWQPDCSIFEDGIYQNEYDFVFKVIDDHCITAKTDSIKMKLKIKDIDSRESEFIPPNFFSPNGDGVNDYFAMELKNDDTGEIKNVLPKDNCYSHFESVRIYNRWGNSVFESSNREFKWDARGESPGVYFYFLKFSRKEYRGTVSLRY